MNRRTGPVAPAQRLCANRCPSRADHAHCNCSRVTSSRLSTATSEKVRPRGNPSGLVQRAKRLPLLRFRGKGCSVRDLSCWRVQASLIPALLKPSAGLESLSIHSNHGRTLSSCKRSLAYWAISWTSSWVLAARTRELQAPSLSQNRITSRPRSRHGLLGARGHPPYRL